MVAKGETIIQRLKSLYPDLQRPYHVGRIGVFGSFARGEATPDSDIDILVQFESPIGWEIVEMKEMLESEFGRKVDLVTEKALKEQMRDRILQEVQYV